MYLTSPQRCPLIMLDIAEIGTVAWKCTKKKHTEISRKHACSIMKYATEVDINY